VGFREERVARNEVAAREINEAIEEADTRPANFFIHILCECGLEDCERVLAITRPVYERVRSDPRQFVILPSHLISEVEDVVLESDGFLIVAKRGGNARGLSPPHGSQALGTQPTTVRAGRSRSVPADRGGPTSRTVGERAAARPELEHDVPCEAAGPKSHLE
jgi:hypothetical protein